MLRRLSLLAVGSFVVVVASGCSGGASSSLMHVPMPATATASVTHESLDSQAIAIQAQNAQIVGLSDNFSGDAIGAPAVGWTVDGGSWSVCQAGTAHAYCQRASASGEALNGVTGWTDYSIDAVVTDPNVTGGGAGIIGRVIGINQFYQLELRAQYGKSTPYWYLEKNNNGSWSTLSSGALSAPDSNPNYRLHLAFTGNQISASIAFDGGTNYVALSTVSDTAFAAGQFGLRTWGTGAAHFGNVLVTLAGPALPSESAVSSSAFVDSIGMNAHFESAPYSLNTAQVSSLIVNLGVRHYRVSAMEILTNSRYLSTLTNLHNANGTTYNILGDLKTSPAQIVKAIGLLPSGSVDSVEGPNESDNPGQGIYYDPKFATDVPAYMQALYTTIKSTPATSQIAVIGPSFVNSTSYAAIGNISTSVDNGNMHDYFGGFSPGTTGWGGGGYPFAPGLNYGSIGWNVASAGQASKTKPVVATETGYYTASIHGGVPLDVQAKYVPRLFMEHYRNNVPRTFSYQLIGYNTTSADGTLGIVSPSYLPSPAFNTLAGLIGLLKDGGTKSAPVNYKWALRGQTSNLHHVLMHKADGTLLIPLWIEAPSFDPNANGGLGAKLTVPQQTITISLRHSAKSAVLWTNNPATGTWNSTPAPIANGSLTFNVTDFVSVLEVAP